MHTEAVYDSTETHSTPCWVIELVFTNVGVGYLTMHGAACI